MTTKTTNQPSDQIFCGVFPTGLIWADRTKEKHGDWIKVAYQNFRTLELEKDDGWAGIPQSDKDAIEQEAEKMQAKRGEKFIVSGSGQWIILGN